MRWTLAVAFTAAISLACTPGAGAKGCIKGAVVGGVAGHMAGHGKLGAAAGCIVGHHEANKKDSNNANAQAPSGQKVRTAAFSKGKSCCRGAAIHNRLAAQQSTILNRALLTESLR
jgi:hypothetical protein